MWVFFGWLGRDDLVDGPVGCKPVDGSLVPLVPERGRPSLAAALSKGAA